MDLADLVHATGVRSMRKAYRQRTLILHFLGLGGGLFTLARLAPPPSPAPSSLVVTAARVNAISSRFWQRHGRTPSAEETRDAVDRFVRQELLVREARRRGLEQGDLLIRRRLLDKMALLDPTVADDPEASYQKAIDLALGREDVIIRRRLMQVMERLAKREAGPVRIRPEDERRYYETHRGDFERPARYGFRHVFVARGERPGEARRRADRLLALLRQNGGAQTAAGLGDPFLLGHNVPLASAAVIATDFGPDFARSIPALPESAWSGPIESAYGWHLVWLEARRAAEPKPLAEVRPVIAAALRAAEEKRRVESLVADLRAAQPVRVEMGSAPVVVAEVES